MKKVDLNEAIWFIILFFLSFYFYDLIYTGNIGMYIHPKMFPWTKIALIALIILTIYQYSRIFYYSTRWKSSNVKIGYAFFTIILSFGLIIKPSNIEGSIIKNRLNSIHENNIGLTLSHDHAKHNESHEKCNHDKNNECISSSNEEELIDSFRKEKIILLNSNNLSCFIGDLYKNLETYEGKSIEVEGYICENKEKEHNELKTEEDFFLTRMFLSCCAADSQVIGFSCTNATASKPQNQTWARISGTIQKIGYKKGERKLVYYPSLKVNKITYVKEPKLKYIYGK